MPLSFLNLFSLLILKLAFEMSRYPALYELILYSRMLIVALIAIIGNS